MTARTLVVEGWRTSTHSYALVNQHQLLHLLRDSRFRLYHRDVPFYEPEWARLPGGLSAPDAQRIAAITPPPADMPSAMTYRISFPMRAYPGEGRTFMFGTCELDRLLPEDLVDASGRAQPRRDMDLDVICPSRWTREAFLTHGFSPSRVHVVPHGIDPGLGMRFEAQERAALRRSLGIPDAAFVFLNISAMTWNKGIGPLIAAFAVHRLRNPGALLLLKASEALFGRQIEKSIFEASSLRTEVRHPGLNAALRYVPDHLPWTELVKLYQAADAYLAPYRAEGFNLPVLEAMAAGLPVIVTGGGATDDFCPAEVAYRIEADTRHGTSGRYLEPRVECLIDLLDRVVGDDAGRRHRSAIGRDLALSHYTWPKVTTALAERLLAPGAVAGGR